MPVDIIQLQPWIALVFGILILAVPQILNYLVAAYLILVGIGGLLAQYGTPIAGGERNKAGGRSGAAASPKLAFFTFCYGCLFAFLATCARARHTGWKRIEAGGNRPSGGETKITVTNCAIRLKDAAGNRSIMRQCSCCYATN